MHKVAISTLVFAATLAASTAFAQQKMDDMKGVDMKGMGMMGMGTMCMDMKSDMLVLELQGAMPPGSPRPFGE